MTATVSYSESWLDGAGGRLFTRHWGPKGPALANLIICHGFNAHSGLYSAVAQHFASQGYAVTATDLRGRGQSDGERFYVETIDDYVSDLSKAVDFGTSRFPDLPTFLLGHSAGGVTSVTYALDNQDRLSGLICEDFAFKVFAPDFAIKLLEGASHVIPHTHVLTLKMEDFSRDPDWVAELNADPLIAGESQPAQTVAALARADERLDREFNRITLPVLILHGTADHAARPDGSEQFYREAGSADKTLKLYEGHYHDLLADIGKEEVIADILGWMGQRLIRVEHVETELPPVTA